MSAWLQRKVDALSEEIRRYPTPISRCDEHLGQLLEERSQVLSLIEKQGCSALALWANDGGFDAA